MNNTATYWNAFKDLYDQGSEFIDAFDTNSLLRDRRWNELTIAYKELAERFVNIANAMSCITEDGVDADAIGYGRKTYEMIEKTTILFEQLAAYFARKTVYSKHHPMSGRFVVRFARACFWDSLGMTPAQRSECTKLDNMNAQLIEAGKEYAVARTMLNAERDYVQKVLTERYEMEFAN